MRRLAQLHRAAATGGIVATFLAGVACGARSELAITDSPPRDGGLSAPLDAGRDGSIGVQLVAGAAFCCLLDASGSASCWGDNRAGQLGNGSEGGDSSFPVAVASGDTAFASLAASAELVCGLDPSGVIHCWGYLFRASVPVATMAQLAVAAGTVCTLSRAGIVECNGALGEDASGDSMVRVDHAQSIASRDNTACALERGRASCWGLNQAGEVGRPPGETERSRVYLVRGLNELVEVAPGWHHTCALDNTGDVYCWGDNSLGQLGRTGPGSVSPTRVFGVPPSTLVRSGHGNSCLVGRDRNLYCWGDNTFGQLGVGTRGGSSAVVRVPLGRQVRDVAIGDGFVCALAEDGATVWCWGLNGRGQLGDGTHESRLEPTPVSL